MKEKNEPQLVNGLLSTPTRLWLVRIASLAGIVLAGWLSVLRHRTIEQGIGCGSQGCELALTGPWAQWMWVPVSVLAMFFYIGVFALTLPFMKRWLGVQLDKLLVAAALLAIGCAAWFGALLWKQGEVCKYCLAAHGVGVFFAATILLEVFTRRHHLSRGLLAGGLATAGLALAVLVLGQAFGPKHFAEIKTTVTDQKYQGEWADFPVLGNADHANQIVKLFDYTCESCRTQHGDFKLILRKHQAQLGLRLVPTPLNRKCNSALPQSVPDHSQACEFARLSLVIWKLAPASWPDFHDQLFENAKKHDLQTAERTAWGLAGGSEKVEAELREPWIQKCLEQATQRYQSLLPESIAMPKTIVGKNVWHGISQDPTDLQKRVEQYFKL